ncbi:FadR/GntR family transcriptional regulator [Asticcacaulis sp. MM231]|uniref:FadR/GntR family transcriptional regulator n=1 Tax=Asticcacaulis sp. MM231 TaxID=3157666 RepID=UPI0032D59286
MLLADRLGADIMSGVYKPGSTLPTEMVSSSSLAISRSAYRETIRTLAAKGLVQSRTKRGTCVNDPSKWNVLDPDVLRWMFDRDPNPQFTRDLFELRLITEPAAAEFAALRASAAEIADMKRALDVMKDKTLMTEEGRAADLEFHRILLAAARNTALASLSSSIGAAISWSTSYKARHNALDRDSMPDHERIYDAIAARNPSEARWAMESLIRLAQGDLQRIDSKTVAT